MPTSSNRSSINRAGSAAPQTRQDREHEELKNLNDILEMYEAKGELFDAAAHGFVFSDQQIPASRQASTRACLATKAYPFRNK